MALQDAAALREPVSSGCRSSDTPAAPDSLIQSYDRTIQDALQKHEYNFVICDPALPDLPIVYASEGFLSMTGYSRSEVIGRNCRFLQGPGTDKRSVLEIREAIREEQPCQVKLLNYTKSGKPFWNLFHLAPVYSQDDGRVVHYVGVQTPVSRALATVFEKQLLELGKKKVEETQLASPRLDENQEEESEQSDEGEASDESDCNVREEDKQRAVSAVKSLLNELAESSNKGVGPRRSKSFSAAVPSRVVCTSLMLSLTRIQQSFVLADPQLPDMPIVHASDLFLKLTGYSRAEVLGRNCRFLQGPETDPKTVEQIRSSIRLEKPCTVRLLNYRKNKEPFWNFLHVAPIRNAKGKVAYFCGIQMDVTLMTDEDEDEEEAEDHQREARMKQLGAVGAIRVAVRSLRAGGPALRRAQTFS